MQVILLSYQIKMKKNYESLYAHKHIHVLL